MENLLEVEKLNMTFGRGKRTEIKAVVDIDLEMSRGEVLLIMGPSGSGKTTLLTMIGSLLKPTSGKVVIDGTDVTNIPINQATKYRRDHIGFIFQSFNLLKNLSALENVMIAGFDQRGVGEKAKKLLGRLGLSERINFKPNDLSGGERQRVAIARALINNPKLILADEPTANLDKSIGHEVMKLLCAIACEEDRGVIIVSHDERIKDVAHRIIYIEDGKLVKEEKGGHNQSCQMRH